MDYTLFKEWLQVEKNMTKRSSEDVVSRCKRINRIMDEEVIAENTIGLLVQTESFENMSSFIKCQLKRAARLYLEYSVKGEENYRN